MHSKLKKIDYIMNIKKIILRIRLSKTINNIWTQDSRARILKTELAVLSLGTGNFLSENSSS